jgi:hypothetical protein
MDDRLVDVMQVRTWLARGELEPVQQWARRRGLLDHHQPRSLPRQPGTPPSTNCFQAEYLALVRLVLAQRQPEHAWRCSPFCRTWSKSVVSNAGSSRSWASRRSPCIRWGNLDQALLAIGRALALAEPEGYQRTFVDEGEPMARLLYQAVARGISPEYAGRLLAVLAQESPEARSAGMAPAGDLIEPLSEREMEVAGPDRRGTVQQRDRQPPVHLPEHGQGTYDQHLRQARGEEPHPGGRPRPQPGPVAAPLGLPPQKQYSNHTFARSQPYPIPVCWKQQTGVRFMSAEMKLSALHVAGTTGSRSRERSMRAGRIGWAECSSSRERRRWHDMTTLSGVLS